MVFLAATALAKSDISGHLVANRAVGVPYDDAMISNALADLEAQADPEADTSGLESRYAKISIRDFDGNPRWSQKWMPWSPICKCWAHWLT